MLPAAYNGDDPRDVADFLTLLFDLHQKGLSGAYQADLLVAELRNSDQGRRLLSNAHKVISMQLGKVPSIQVMHAQLWIQKLTGMFQR